MDVLPYSWDDLKLFLVVARLGSFHAAGAALQIKHSTLSRRVARLESELQCTLLQRGSRGVALTPAGTELMAVAERLSRDLRAATQELSGRDGAGRVGVRIATSGILANAYLTSCVAAAYDELRDVELVLLVDSALAQLSDGSVDIAVRMLPPGHKPAASDVRARKAGKMSFSLFGSKRYLAKRPANPAQSWQGHRLIGYVGATRAPGSEYLASAMSAAEVLLKTNTVTVAAAAIAAGHGIGVIPDFYARAIDPGLVQLVPRLDTSDIWVLMRPELARDKRVVTVQRYLVREIQAAFGG